MNKTVNVCMCMKLCFEPAHVQCSWGSLWIHYDQDKAITQNEWIEFERFFSVHLVVFCSLLGQNTVFHCLGEKLLDNAFQGYNACIFAYGQTGTCFFFKYFIEKHASRCLKTHCNMMLFQVTLSALLHCKDRHLKSSRFSYYMTAINQI